MTAYHRRMRRVVLSVALLLPIVLAVPAARQDPALAPVLTSAAAYVARYADTMSKLVAEEKYVQDLIPVSSGASSTSGGLQQVAPTVQHRELKSEVALMRTGPGSLWTMYRDVFEVGGSRVRERDHRLTRILTEPVASARAKADLIAGESARFNLGGTAWMNEPGLPLMFLLTEVQSGCVFTLERRDRDVWTVAFEERRRPTLLRHNGTDDNPASGRFSIQTDTGEVRRAELNVSPPGRKATFVTTFKHDDRYKIAMPSEMREQMTEGVDAGTRRIETHATYSNYKTFGVRSGWRPM